MFHSLHIHLHCTDATEQKQTQSLFFSVVLQGAELRSAASFSSTGKVQIPVRSSAAVEQSAQPNPSVVYKSPSPFFLSQGSSSVCVDK